MTTTVESATATPVAIGAPRGGPDQPTLRKDGWWVEPVGHRHGADRLRRLLDLGRLRGQGLLRRRRPAPRPDLALLLALHRQQLRAGQPRLRHAAVLELLAGAAHPHLPARLPPHLLLLPQGLLPVLLVVAAGVRGGRRPRQLQRRDPLPAHPPERPPLLLLDPPRSSTASSPTTPSSPSASRVIGIGISVGTVVLCVNAALPVALQPVVPRLPALLRRPGASRSPSTRCATSSGSSSRRSTPTTCASPGSASSCVALSDLYVRLVASGTIHDPGFHF